MSVYILPCLAIVPRSLEASDGDRADTRAIKGSQRASVAKLKPLASMPGLYGLAGNVDGKARAAVFCSDFDQPALLGVFVRFDLVASGIEVQSSFALD